MGKTKAPNDDPGGGPLQKKERRHHQQEGRKNGDPDSRPDLIDLSGESPSRVAVGPSDKPINVLVPVGVGALSNDVARQATYAKKLPFVFDLTVDTTPPLVAAAPPPKRDDDSSDSFTLDKFPTGKSDPNVRHENLSLDRAFALQLEREYKEEGQHEMEQDEALARRVLQDDEPEHEHDEEIARELQTKLHQEEKAEDEHDEEIARELEAKLHQEEKAEEERKMGSTHSGKSWKFVDKVLKLHKQVQGDIPDSKLDPVAVDDMVYLAEAMLTTQEEFSQAGKPVLVDIGYHYTRKDNMTRIKTNGLLTKAERDTGGITSHHNGSAYGDGVYTGNEPTRFQGYGDVGLIVARLQGSVSPAPVRHGRAWTHDTVSPIGGNALGMVVLCKSSQCLALIEYSTSLLVSNGSEVIAKYHSQLQKIVDEFFNGGVVTEVPKLHSLARNASAQIGQPFPFPMVPTVAITIPPAIAAQLQHHASQMRARSRRRQHSSVTGVLPGGILALAHPPVLRGLDEIVRYDAPDALNHGVDPNEIFCNVHQSSVSNDDCAICLMSLGGADEKVASLRVCGHEFHFSCINSALQHSKTCPACRKAVGKPQGRMPSGTMRISSSTSKGCGGFAGGSIKIGYSIQGGIQKGHHANPGTMQGGAHRVAYLPDNTDGHKLLKRLKFAFQHGLTFTVGTSLTTNIPNQVTWASIHHKTSRSGGPHGFPDANYFANCNQELDALNVPHSDSL